MTPLLEVRDLSVTFRTADGDARAPDGISLDVADGEMVALVGESGCGKSATALALMRLLPPQAAIGPSSRITFDGRDLLALDAAAMRDLRGRRIAMIFQEPATALNPVMRVGAQVAETALLHGERSRRAAMEHAITMLARTGIADAAACAMRYPHELSGGTRQRVLIAMALLLDPSLVIADEPTSALDVTVQAQILDLLRSLQRETGTAVLLITHDLGVVAETCSRVIVMYAGRVVEEAPTARLFASPAHPYTEGLLRAMPRLGSGGARFEAIPGSVPPAVDWPSGCRFRERCAFAWDRCAREEPPLLDAGGGARSRCHLVAEPGRRAPRTGAGT